MYDYLPSFDIYYNYRQIMKTTSQIIYKRSRTNIKFVTFDYKYQFAFSKRKQVKDFCDIVKNYETFYLNKVWRANTS